MLFNVNMKLLEDAIMDMSEGQLRSASLSGSSWEVDAKEQAEIKYR